VYVPNFEEYFVRGQDTAFIKAVGSEYKNDPLIPHIPDILQFIRTGTGHLPDSVQDPKSCLYLNHIAQVVQSPGGSVPRNIGMEYDFLAARPTNDMSVAELLNLLALTRIRPKIV
jgi:hypothetical protein